MLFVGQRCRHCRQLFSLVMKRPPAEFRRLKQVERYGNGTEGRSLYDEE